MSQDIYSNHKFINISGTFLNIDNVVSIDCLSSEATNHYGFVFWCNDGKTITSLEDTQKDYEVRVDALYEMLLMSGEEYKMPQFNHGCRQTTPASPELLQWKKLPSKPVESAPEENVGG